MPDGALVPNSVEKENTYTIYYPNGLIQQTKRDAFGELKSVNHLKNLMFPQPISILDATSSVSIWNESFDYDGFGNITSLNRNGSAYSFEYDGVNRVKKEVNSLQMDQYTYDYRGNIGTFTRGTTTDTRQYDAANRMISNGQYSYAYDNRGNRKTKSTPSVSETYDYNAI